MSGLVLRRGLCIALVLSVLGLCIFGDCAALRSSGFLAPGLVEIAAVLADSGTQWVVFGCAGLYFLGFVVRWRLAGRAEDRAGGGSGWSMTNTAGKVRAAWSLAAQWFAEPAFCLTGLLAMTAAAYALKYQAAVKSTQALTLLGAAVLGQGAAYWEGRRKKEEYRERGRRRAEAENRKQKCGRGDGAGAHYSAGGGSGVAGGDGACLPIPGVGAVVGAVG